MPSFEQNIESQTDAVKNDLFTKVKAILPAGLLTRDQLYILVEGIMEKEEITKKYGVGRAIAFRNSIIESIYIAQGGDSLEKHIQDREHLDVVDTAPIVRLTQQEPEPPLQVNIKPKKSVLVAWEEEKDARQEKLAGLAQKSPEQGELPL